MKFAAAFAVLAVLSAKTFVSAFSTADDFDLEMRDELSDGELYDILARELLDYSDELDEVNARDLYDDEDFLYIRVPVYGTRLNPLKMAKNTGETRLQNAVQKVIDQRLRGPQPQVRIPRPSFKDAAKKVIQQNRLPNAAEVTRQDRIANQNLRQKIKNINDAKRK